jgi:hypothetical protein
MRVMAMGRQCAAAAFAIAIALVLAAPAAALPGRSLSLSLRNADGYRVTVTGSGPTVALSVRRPRQRSETVYIVHGAVNANSIRARFPGIGRVAVGFHPAAPSTAGRPRCKDAARGRSGIFRGTIEFRGENGYTSVHAHRAKGQAIDSRRLSRRARRCLAKLSSSGGPGQLAAVFLGFGPPQPKTTRIIADGKQPLGGALFEAKRIGKRRARFLALEEGVEGRLAILHLAFAPASPLTFASDPALSFASVSPPAPFSGSGDLRHNPDGSKSWTGTLSVSFPGAPDVPLTGPGFKTVLTRSWGRLPTVPAERALRLLAAVP